MHDYEIAADFRLTAKDALASIGCNVNDYALAFVARHA